MDVISVATTVFALCKAITTWIDELAQRDAIILEISSIVLQIRDILEPFTIGNLELDGTGELQLSQSIRSVGDILERTREHLIVWKYKKFHKVISFLKPSTLIQQLRDDERQLGRQLLILLTSLSVVGYFRDLALKRTIQDKLQSHPQPVAASSEASSDTLGTLSNASAVEFWNDFVGTKIEFISEELFLTRLNSWYGGDISINASNHIIMCLDEFNMGGVTLYNLCRSLGKETLKEFVERYVNESNTLVSSKIVHDVELKSQLKVPLLVWVDDNPDNNQYEAATASMMGIQVIQLTSTALAKAWVEDNEVFLRENDDASRVRFITDNARAEFTPENGVFFNYRAGQNFLQYLRGHLYKAPVLVYTGGSINETQYVKLYESAGSTINAGVCMDYITNLANRQTGDRSWTGFKKNDAFYA